MYSCRRCGKRSANPTDEAEGYCGACHAFTGAEPLRLGRLPMLTMMELSDLHALLDERIFSMSTSAHSEQEPFADTPGARLVADRVATLVSLRTAVAEASAHAIVDAGEALVLIADLERVLGSMTLRSPNQYVPVVDIFAQALGAMKATVLHYIAAENLAEIVGSAKDLQVRPPALGG